LHSSGKERVSGVTRLQFEFIVALVAHLRRVNLWRRRRRVNNGTLLPFSLHFNPVNPVILSKIQFP